MKITRDQIMAKLAERKAKALAESKRKALAERKAKALAERKTKLNAPARRPMVRENTQRLNETRTVLKEQMAQRREARTLTEDINKRTRGIKNPQMKNIVTTLAENIYNHNKSFMEATQAGMGITGAIGNGAGVGLVKTYFDIFFGYFPNLIAPLIASTQPIKTPNAVVFYYQSVAGSDKGNVQKGQVLIDPFQINTDVDYTSQVVNMADATASGTYSDTRPAWGPLVPRGVQIEGAELTWSTDTAFTGTLGALNITAGTVTENAGNVTVAFTLSGAPAAPVKVSYLYDNVYAPTQTPELNANVVEIPIQAKTRTIKTNFSFQAGYGFEAQFGVKLDDKLAEAAMYELKREIDLDIVGKAFAAAPTLITWNKNVGTGIGTYEFHKLSFQDAVIAASNHIYRISKRVRGNVLVVGTTAQTVVETLPGFKGENFGSQLGGPAVIGKLKDITVIATPDIPADDFLVLFKDQKDDLNAGIIFAPYLPVFATQPVMLDDFMYRRAFAEAHGTVVVNPNYFVRGRIINDPVAQPMALVGKDGTDYLELGNAADGGIILP